MTNFPKAIASRIFNSGRILEENLVILPTQRSATFVRKELENLITDTAWLPEFLTLNRWTEKLAGLKTAESLELRFICYNAYCDIMEGQAQPISDFFGWCDLMIRDFNDIESQLINPAILFKSLSEYTEIEHFSFLKSPLSEKQVRYKSFWDALPGIHQAFNKKLIAQGLGYSGLVLAKALDAAIPSDQFITVAGFNALSNAEAQLLKKLQTSGNGEIIYDADHYYLSNVDIHAGIFIRRNLKKDLGKVFTTEKSLAERPINIEICEAAHRQEQAELTAALIAELSPNALKNTVLVLADEAMLIPVLAKLPPNAGIPNITMGLGLGDSMYASWLQSFFDVAVHKSTTGNARLLSAARVKTFSNHPFSRKMALGNLWSKLMGSSFLDAKHFKSEGTISTWDTLALDFWLVRPVPLELESDNAIDRLIKVFGHLETLLDQGYSVDIDTLQAKKGTAIMLRALRQLKLIEQSAALSIPVLKSILLQALSGGQVDLLGDAIGTLQIMGLLETRALSFERAIICSVNEDMLPKKANLESIIPFEIRMHHQLPGRREKEGVFAYYFYRLLQYANNVSLVYHSDREDFSGGEKSRYIYQLEHELKRYNPNLDLKYRSLSRPEPQPLMDEPSIAKSPEVLSRIKAHIEKGLSASSINGFLEDSLEWYYAYPLGLREPKEAVIDNADFGTVAHAVLENLYQNLENKIITNTDMAQMIKRADAELKAAFLTLPYAQNLEFGINKVHFETAKSMIHGFLASEKALIEKGQEVQYIASEVKLERQLKMDVHGAQVTARFKGYADRVEKRNGQLRIVDYKTGRVEEKDLYWKECDAEGMAKYPKALQLLMYNWMASERYGNNDISAQIISLPRARNRELLLKEDLNMPDGQDIFEGFLKDVVNGMMDVESPLERNKKYRFAVFENN